MKQVYFIRHAKSSWSSGASRDIDRPLNKRGKRDAPFMAKTLKTKVSSVDGIIKSPARRISETVQPFIKEFDLSLDNILTERSIYGGSVSDMIDAIQSLPSEWNTILLFGHNPGMTDAAHYFGGSNIINIPTCGIFEVSSSADKWASFNQANSNLKSFIYPKQFFSE